MFKIMIVIVAFAIIAVACEDNKTDMGSSQVSNLEVQQQGLIGSWHWVSAKGGRSNVIITPEGSGIERMLVFTPDIYLKIENGDTVETGQYFLNKGRSIVKWDSVMILSLQDRPFVLETLNDTLRITDDNPDGLTYEYLKIE